jgi:hypothetical protein
VADEKREPSSGGEPVVAGPRECDDCCDDLDFTSFDPFPTVLASEYEDVQERRQVAAGGAARATGRPLNLAGLSLSGGGIRSATFNLGLLQSLRKHGLLQQFDYLSTVSGGGYCGGWWSGWLARDSRAPGKEGFFPDDERIEPERHTMRQTGARAAATANDEYAEPSESAMNAGSDPIHHLRLFSNFLTPRKGLLSADTWRAITTIGRNLVLTWLILLPLLLAAIMGGQAYFALITGDDFEHRVVMDEDVDTLATSAVDAEEKRHVREANVQTDTRTPGERLRKRLFAALLPSLFLFVGVVLCVLLWMVFTRNCWKLRDIVIVMLTLVAFTALTLIALMATQVLPAQPLIWQFLGGASLVFIVLLVLVGWRRRKATNAAANDTSFWRNQIARFQTRLLQSCVLLAVVLLFAGFGHEVIDFLLYDTKFHDWVGASVVKAGGWAAVILSLVGAAYTATRAAPSGGGDSKPKKPGLFDQIVFALIPPLLLLVLALFLSWVGHRWYSAVYEDRHGEILWILLATLISAFLFLSMALYEFRPRAPQKALLLVTGWAISAAVVIVAPLQKLGENLFAICIGTTIFVLGALFLRGKGTKRKWGAIIGSALAGAAVGIGIDVADKREQLMALPIPELPYVIVIGVIFAITLLAFELIYAQGSNDRSFALMGIGFAMLVLVGIASCSDEAYAWRMLAMFGCISTVMGWVLSLGWLLDPNMLTIHAFYKARLVRAYIGASNEQRAKALGTDITEAVPGDDVALVNLANTSHGAPYHLINTTLNLVGGRDLATVQRFSDYFVMSKRYCGSLRTGYRPTDEYACGTMSLGTAVSVSGAAASPNMGAQTPSAALAMLLTLFNVRLGFWTPTPNRAYWRAGSARLWPFYTVQELLSQTTDLLSFCYLTDGGHFDNSGVYSLIQRGCRYIVMADCGADPDPSFGDLGDLVRKVRIDFGTEIDICIDDMLKPPKKHFIAGTIRYSDVHADMLGLTKDERNGILIVVKPNRTPGASVDVLQYGFANDDFPQQTTADQWYDEQQFESYRKLGEISGNALFAASPPAEIGEFFAAVQPTSSDAAL